MYRHISAIALAAGLIIQSQGIGRLIGEFAPSAISADDSTIVGFNTTPSDTEFDAQRYGVVWTQATGAVLMPAPAEEPSSPQAVSGDGSIVVGYNGNLVPARSATAWSWTSSGGYQNITVPGSIGGHATSISDDGSVIGITAQFNSTGVLGSDSVNRAYIMSAASGFFEIPPTLSGKTPASAIVLGNGQTVIGNDGAGGYIWTASGGSVDIPTLAGIAVNEPEVATPDGSAVFGISGIASAKTVFEYSHGNTISLGVPITLQSEQTMQITGVTANGQILVGLVGTGDTGDSPYLFVWTMANGFMPLETFLVDNGINEVLGPAKYNSITGISPDGKIIFGTEVTTDGLNETFAWRFQLPEPEQQTLMLSVLMCGVVRRPIKTRRAWGCGGRESRRGRFAFR